MFDFSIIASLYEILARVCPVQRRICKQQKIPTGSGGQGYSLHRHYELASSAPSCRNASGRDPSPPERQGQRAYECDPGTNAHPVSAEHFPRQLTHEIELVRHGSKRAFRLDVSLHLVAHGIEVDPRHIHRLTRFNIRQGLQN